MCAIRSDSREQLGKSDLAPDHLDDFRSVEYWEKFFKSRGEVPFEWYGDWGQLKAFLVVDCKPEAEALVVGCGNSELSSFLYDSGCQLITNIDFSKCVIASMLRKNVRLRPKMKWKVGDMTNIKADAGSFDVVIDKGGLDALMGEDSPEGHREGLKLLQEAERVLRPQGAYLCVTLAQAHVLKLLLDYFEQGWSLKLSACPVVPDMARSPLQPFFIRAAKLAARDVSAAVEFQGEGSDSIPNAEQIADIRMMVDEENAKRLHGKRNNLGKAQAESAESEDFEGLHPGRRLCLRSAKAGDAFQACDTAEACSPLRFSAVSLDLDAAAAAAAVQQCCVFIVPQGRESEWLFASEPGQWEVARQCSCQRVVLVALGRGHHFGSLAAIKAELSAIVAPLAPLDVRHLSNAIPFMTTREGIGSRHLVEQLDSSVSGRVVVEDVKLEDEQGTRFVRRLVFASNQSLIQSEALLRGGGGALQSQAAVPRKGRRSKTKQQEPADRHKGSSADLGHMEVDHRLLPMAYHKHLVAAVACSPSAGSEAPVAMIVGLGAGGVAMFLASVLEVAIEAVELDPMIVDVAKRHFSLTEGPNLQEARGSKGQSKQVTVGDGIEAVAAKRELQQGSLSALIVDAGSGDASLAMSCPPPSFLEPSFLENAHQALQPGGVLAINCVTRDEPTARRAINALKDHFSAVVVADVEQDVNRVLLGCKAGGPQTLAAEAFSKLNLEHRLKGLVNGRLSGSRVSDLASASSSWTLLH